MPLVLGDHVTLEAGTGLVHTAPAHGVDDFEIGSATACRSTSRWTTTAATSRACRTSRAWACARPRSRSSSCSQRNGALLHRTSAAATAIRTAGATRRRSSSARRRSGSSAWTRLGARRGRGRTLRELALQAIGDTTFYPAWGRARLEAMIENRPDWCCRASATGACRCRSSCTSETDELHPRHGRAAGAGGADASSKGGIEAWFAATCEDFGVDPAQLPQDLRHRGRVVRFRHDALHGAARRRRTAHGPPTCTSRAPTSIAAGSSRACSPAAPSTAARPTRRCSRTASWWTARAARCPSRWAT